MNGFGVVRARSTDSILSNHIVCLHEILEE